MTAPWLHVIGLGEDGWTGLAPAARAVLETADLIVGGDRHHALLPDLGAARLTWPSPFHTCVDHLVARRGDRVAVVVTGDPLWYSAGALFQRHIPAAEITYHPQLSSFQWAAARLGWSLADLETLTIHGRPAEQILPFLAPGQRLLLLTRDGDSPVEVADLLRQAGYGPSVMTALIALGGPDEAQVTGTADDWGGPVADFHVLAIDLVAAPGTQPLPRIGLPDEAFQHDGKMTKRELRALTLAALSPWRGAHLWDIGAGCGSVGIEWMRGAPDATCDALEPLADRRAMAATNAQRLGAPRLALHEASAPEGLVGLRDPDAIFIGGGLSEAVIDHCLARLRPFGRLVANAVTLESEAILSAAQARHGGSLTRVQVARAEGIGRYRGWRSHMPVTQWVLQT